MTRTPASAILLAAVACLGAQPVTSQERPPNVVVILTDDQGWGDIGYHNERVQSPGT